MASNGLQWSKKFSNRPTWPQIALKGLKWPLLASNEGFQSLVEYLSIIIWLNDFSKIKLSKCSKKYPVSFFYVHSLVVDW